MNANAAYHADFSRVSASMLKVFLDSRREYEARFITRTMEAEPPSDPMQLGSLSHAMLLEPHTLGEYIVIPDGVLASNGARIGKEWKAFAEANAGKMLLKEDEFEAARRMVASIKAKCGDWFDNVGDPEQPLHWDCPISGVPCKAKPDYLIRKSDPLIVLDVKTAGDAMPAGFRSSVKRYRYYLQEAHYCNGIVTTTGLDVAFYFVVVQSKPPYQCRVYEIPENDACPAYARIDKSFAADVYVTAMNQLATCYASGDWSDPGEDTIYQLHYEDCQ